MTLRLVTWEQRILEGDRKFEGSQDLPDFSYAEYAKMLGLQGIKIDQPEDIIPSLEHAFILNKPVVIDVYTDPSVPPLPPNITFKQAKAFASSMIKGNAKSWDMIRPSWKDIIENYLPHTHI